MKIDRCLFGVILAGFLVLPVKTSHAQSNLVTTANWTAQPIDFGGIFGVFTTIDSNGDFSAIFSQDGGSISQTMATTPGMNYELTFQAIQYDGVTAASVSVDDDLLANFSPDDPFISPVNASYSQYNTVRYDFDYSFMAASANTTITFAENPTFYEYAEDNPFSSYSGLDDISVTEAPEPPALALLAVGWAGWLVWRWPGRRKVFGI